VRALLLLLALVATPAMSQITIADAWTRATAPGAKVGAGYMVIRNASKAADKLVAASSPAAQKVETHVTVKDGDIFRMREVKGYDISAGGAFELKPGGAHLMLVNLKAPLKEGDKVPLTLRFERAGEVRTELRVGRLTDTGKHSH
jgi:periplasmic copper chaperone A